MPLNNLYISNSDKSVLTLPLAAKKLWFLVAFVVVFLLGMDYVFMNYVVFYSEISNQGKLRRLIENTDNQEVAMFGSSLARSSFIPDSIGEHAFNYGMGKAIYDVNRLLLQIECAKDKNAPIIMEFNPRTFIKEPLSTINRSTYIPNLDYPEVERFMRESGHYDGDEFKSAYSWHYKVPGLRLYGNYAEYFFNMLRRKTKDKDINRGVMLEDKQVSALDLEVFLNRCVAFSNQLEAFERKKTDPNDLYTPIDSIIHRNLRTTLKFSYDEGYMQEFKELLRANRHRKFILVSVPVNPQIKQYLQGFDEFLVFAQGIDAEFDNVYYLDYSDLPTTIEMFKDPSHFNRKGAQYFMSVFGPKFRELTGVRQ